MKLIKLWFRNLFKKTANVETKTMARHLLNEIVPVIKGEDYDGNKIVVSDGTDLTIRHKGETIGTGTVAFTSMTVDDNNFVHSIIYDLEIVNLDKEATFLAEYRGIGYDDATKLVTHDISIIFENARLNNGIEIVCHKEDVKMTITKREAS